MAADSSAIDQGMHVVVATKMWRAGGGLIGMAGTILHMEPFVRWIMNNDGEDTDAYPRGDFDAIVVSPSGRISLYEGGGPDPIVWRGAPYVAIGSGGPLALAAMDAGAGARQAVKIAIGRDINSKPPVRLMRLK
jgi:hypothetical protein